MNCRTQRPPPRSKHCIKRRSATALKDGGLPRPLAGMKASHWTWATSDAAKISRAFVSCAVQNSVAWSTFTVWMNSRASSDSVGNGSGLARKNSSPKAFRVWPIRPIESVIWQVAPFLCSPAQVYLMGLKNPYSRSLLYEPGRVHVGIEPGAKGRIVALWRNFPTIPVGSPNDVFFKGSPPPSDRIFTASPDIFSGVGPPGLSPVSPFLSLEGPFPFQNVQDYSFWERRSL